MPSDLPPQTGFISSLPGESPSYVEAWHDVLQLGAGLDDARLIAEFGCLSGLTADRIPVDQSSAVEASADVRVPGEESLNVRVLEPTLEHIHRQFAQKYEERHGRAPVGSMEVVAIRLRRFRKPHD